MKGIDSLMDYLIYNKVKSLRLLVFLDQSFKVINDFLISLKVENAQQVKRKRNVSVLY